MILEFPICLECLSGWDFKIGEHFLHRRAAQQWPSLNDERRSYYRSPPIIEYCSRPSDSYTDLPQKTGTHSNCCERQWLISCCNDSWLPERAGVKLSADDGSCAEYYITPEVVDIELEPPPYDEHIWGYLCRVALNVTIAKGMPPIPWHPIPPYETPDRAPAILRQGPWVTQDTIYKIVAPVIGQID